jgi:putative DNA primase/helicase
MTNGCKADHVLILEGRQGSLKSTALRTLAYTKEWFNETPFDIGSKDSYLGLRGKWIVELAEMDSFSRADSSRAKAFFSSLDDTYRPPYGIESITVPRQCIFAGTVNHETYLKDETGNRRYWPVKCTRILIDKLRADVPQLWAEAMQLFSDGHPWWPASPRDHELCRIQQEERSDADSWVPTIADWIEGQEYNAIMREREPDVYLTTADVLGRCLLMPKSQWTTGMQSRVGNILKDLGWERSRVMRSNARSYIYIPPTETKDW